MNVTINKYLKVLVAAQRSKQIRNGARPLVQMQGVRAIRLALEEVKQGLISFDFTPVEWNAKSEPDHRADLSPAEKVVKEKEDDRVVNQPAIVKLND